MRTAFSRSPVLMLLCAMALLLGGCTNYKSLTFRVVDLESREPIGGAVVTIEQGVGDAPFGPKTHTGTTDPSGITKVIAADMPFVSVTAEAHGFLTERLRLVRPHLQGSVETASIGAVERLNDTEYEIRLLRGVQPVITLVVPEEYTGTIDLEYSATDDWEPGQRRFVVTVVDGVAELPSAPALDVAHRFQARRTTGETIPGPLGSWEDKESLRSGIRLRGPIDGVRVPIYVIGDLERFRRVMNAMYR